MAMLWVYLETAQWGVSGSDSLRCSRVDPVFCCPSSGPTAQSMRLISNSNAATFSLTCVCFMTVCYFQSCSYLTVRLYGLLCTINVLYETRLLCFFSFIKS